MGPIAEVAQTFHQTNSRVIHINPSTIPSGIKKKWGQRKNGVRV
ncbi:MAG: hypothetical protein H7Z12_02945 [Rhodospirillaceae bacterium]|nr:hypothetical protein [Rhodospirillales bacterium]